MSLIQQELEKIWSELQGGLPEGVALESILADRERNKENHFNMIAYDLDM